MISDIVAAYDLRARLANRIERIRTVAAKAGRDLSDADRLDIADQEMMLETAGRELAREREALEVERSKFVLHPPGSNHRWPGQLTGDPVRPFDSPRRTIAGTVGTPRFSALFPKVQLTTEEWPDYDSFLNIVHAGVSDPGLTAMTEGAGPEGGWAVPTQFAAEMLDAAMEASVMIANGARVYPMTSRELQVAGFDASTNTSGSLYGGIESQWLGEGDTGSVTNPAMRTIKFVAKKLALFASTSNEVAADGLSLQTQLTEAMTLANGWFLDHACLRGSGAGQPLGVLNAPALVTVLKATSQDADSIVSENLTAMLGRLHPGCFRNSIWLANPGCIDQLLQLTQPIGLGGFPIAVLKEGNGGWSIFTRPLPTTEKLPAIGDKGDILLLDPTQYGIGLRAEMSLERSGHLLFMSDQSVWRAITRCDGMGKWNKAFTPANGPTQSWAVCIEART